MEKRKHYWNGRWGRLARHDVVLYEDAGHWAVEHRIGGVEGPARRQEFEQEDSALDHVRDLMDVSDNWVEI